MAVIGHSVNALTDLEYYVWTVRMPALLKRLLILVLYFGNLAILVAKLYRVFGMERDI